MKPSESYLIEQSIKNSSHDCCNHSMNKGKKSPWPLIPVSRALEIILENCQFLPTIQVPLSKSLGYIVAEDIKSPHNLPPFRASIKDGYAVRSKVFLKIFFYFIKLLGWTWNLSSNKCYYSRKFTI